VDDNTAGRGRLRQFTRGRQRIVVLPAAIGDQPPGFGRVLPADVVDLRIDRLGRRGFQQHSRQQILQRQPPQSAANDDGKHHDQQRGQR